MRFVIVTGMSGAGKTTALKMLEDFGYYCVDNLPVALIENFTKLTQKDGTYYEKVALGIDSRSDMGFELFSNEWLEDFLKKYTCEILFLDASNEVLTRRYKESRRRHPLAGMTDEHGEERSLADCISLERSHMKLLRERANYLVDTSKMLTREIRSLLQRVFVDDMSFHSMNITLKSFGFKYGVPQDADLVFDARFLPNPYYVEELKTLTGNDKPVYDYVMGYEVSQQFYKRLVDLVDFLIPNYIAEGKSELVIAIGCTGGRHRSVTMVNALFEALKGGEYGLRKEHSVVGK